jgi:hypothetical protein
MGGPGALVVLGREPNAEDRLGIEKLLESMGTRPPSEETWPAVWIVSTKTIGGSYEGKGLPFGLEWISGDGHAEQEDFPTYRDDVCRKFGLRPSAFLSLTAGCNGKEDHRVLGELALHLAHTLGGVIDFGGALMPVVSPAIRKDFAKMLGQFEQANWAEVSEPTQQLWQSMPGRILEIPYQTANESIWVTHVCDTEFMAAWLRHPHFHMIK